MLAALTRHPPKTLVTSCLLFLTTRVSGSGAGIWEEQAPGAFSISCRLVIPYLYFLLTLATTALASCLQRREAKVDASKSTA